MSQWTGNISWLLLVRAAGRNLSQSWSCCDSSVSILGSTQRVKEICSSIYKPIWLCCCMSGCVISRKCTENGILDHSWPNSRHVGVYSVSEFLIATYSVLGMGLFSILNTQVLLFSDEWVITYSQIIIIIIYCKKMYGRFVSGNTSGTNIKLSKY